MPNIKASDVAKLSQYERDAGIDNGAPLGKHNVKVERAEVRKDDKGVPQIFTLLRVKGGDADNRTIPNSCRWFVNETNQDGSAKDATKIKQGQSFVRQSTMSFIKAVLGKDIASWPDSVVLPGDDVTLAEVAEAFATIAEAITGREASVEVTTRYEKDKATGKSVETDYQNFKFTEASEETTFKL